VVPQEGVLSKKVTSKKEGADSTAGVGHLEGAEKSLLLEKEGENRLRHLDVECLFERGHIGTRVGRIRRNRGERLSAAKGKGGGRRGGVM